MRWLAPGVVVVAMLCVVAAASAQATAPSVDVTWSAPVECPSQAAVLGEVRSILEGSTVTAHPVDARAAVTRTRKGWHVELAIRSDQGSGERSLDADSCAELASAVALIVALAVDPTRRALAPAPTPPAPTPPTPPTATPPPDAAPPAIDAGPSAPSPLRPADVSDEEDGPRLAIGAAGAADFGTLPSPALGGTVSVAGLYRWVRVEARGRIFASQRANDTARPSQGVDLRELGLDVRACFAVLETGRTARDGLAISPCLGIDASRVSGSGFGGEGTGTTAATSTLSGTGALLGLEAGVLGTWALGSVVALRVGLDLLVPTSRPAFVVLAADGTTASTLHKPAAFAGRIDLGAELRFW